MRSIEHGLRFSDRPWASLGDAGLLIELPLLALASRILPPPQWNALCESIEKLLGGGSRAPSATADQIVEYFRGRGDAPGDPRALARAIGAARREHYMQVLHAWRPGARPPGIATPTRLAGREALDTALAANKGVVLWIAHFAFAPLATKTALAEAGYRAWHMSRPEHGFSKTRFGIAVLNPIRWRVEQHYLAGRLSIDRRNPAAATLRATRLLADNAIISITAGDWEGARVLQAPIGGASLGLSSGAPALAHLSGASLLPVIAVRSAPGAAIDVIVQSAVEPDRSMPRGLWVEAATLAFVDRLKPFVERHPEQWRDWKRLRFEGEPAKGQRRGEDAG